MFIPVLLVHLIWLSKLVKLIFKVQFKVIIEQRYFGISSYLCTLVFPDTIVYSVLVNKILTFNWSFNISVSILHLCYSNLTFALKCSDISMVIDNHFLKHIIMYHAMHCIQLAKHFWNFLQCSVGKMSWTSCQKM